LHIVFALAAIHAVIIFVAWLIFKGNENADWLSFMAGMCTLFGTSLFGCIVYFQTQTNSGDDKKRNGYSRIDIKDLNFSI